MSTYLSVFASAEATAEGGDIFSALGIDLATLIFQIIAFLILVFVLGKFVYPVLMKSVDAHQAQLEESEKAAEAAKADAERAQADIAAMLERAKHDAHQIVETAKSEAVSMAEDAEKRAKDKAAALVSSAETQIQQDIATARDALMKDMREFVADATMAVTRVKLDDAADDTLISSAIKEAKR